jgi:signal transduction histidine kinase
MLRGAERPNWPIDEGSLLNLFSDAPSFIAITHGPEHRWVFANHAFERLFANRAVSGVTVLETFPETVEQGFIALLDRVYATGERFVGEQSPLRLAPRTADEVVRELYLDFSYEPIRAAAGTVTGIFISGFDVTARVLATAALREREERYRALFNAIDEGFCLLEMIFDEDERPIDYRFLETNATFERQTDLVGAVGRTARELVPNLEAHWFAVYGRVALTGEPIRFVEGSDEMGRWFDVYATRVGGEASRTVALLFTDITARRRAEAEREALLAAEREARAAAEAAVQARDTFLSIAAHELKTPLTSLKGGAQLLRRRQLRDDLPPERLRSGLDQIIRSVDRLNALTDDLLDVARLRTGQLPLAPRPLDLVALVEGAVANARERIGEAHSLVVTRLASLPPVRADEGRIEQVFDNLLDNAIKYSPEGGAIAVTIRAEGAGVAVAVRDAGIGLPAGAAAVIFEPFARATNAAASNLPGLGLGLFICRSIVERHGGWIKAESAGVGAGTTITCWLPCDSPPDEAAGAPTTAS